MLNHPHVGECTVCLCRWAAELLIECTEVVLATGLVLAEQPEKLLAVADKLDACGAKGSSKGSSSVLDWELRRLQKWQS
jgi:hypothetical protein